MNCCANCFDDYYLATVIEDNSETNGKCDYCESEAVPLIPPHFLVDYFEILTSIYLPSEDPEAMSLSLLLNEDWEIGCNLNTGTFDGLLRRILGDEYFYDSYVPVEDVASSLDTRNWEVFREELKHENRYFPKNITDEDHLSWLLNFMSNKDFGTVGSLYYRVRKGLSGTVFSKDDMKMPPKDKARGGRANPLGISYLYLASDENTAIAEVRPHKGETIYVATFEVIEKLNLVDLRNPRKTVSPLSLEEENLKTLYLNLGYLCRLGDELSMPILPKDAELEYLPSQYLCEFIKHCFYDGVVFKSSVGAGVNFAFFHDEKLEIKDNISENVVNLVEYDWEAVE